MLYPLVGLYSPPVPTLPRAAQLLDQNAELAARLKVAEESLRQIKQAHEKLQTEHRHTLESKMLLEEEVRFLKNYIYGRSSEKMPGALPRRIRRCCSTRRKCSPPLRRRKRPSPSGPPPWRLMNDRSAHTVAGVKPSLRTCHAGKYSTTCHRRRSGAPTSTKECVGNRIVLSVLLVQSAITTSRRRSGWSSMCTRSTPAGTAINGSQWLRRCTAFCRNPTPAPLCWRTW